MQLEEILDQKLDEELRRAGDEGVALLRTRPDSPAGRFFRQLAGRVRERLERPAPERP